MAEPIKISTSKYTKSGKVEIDGHIWTVKLPGANTELGLSQAFRKSKVYAAQIEKLEKKIDDSSIKTSELDKLEEYITKYETIENYIFDFFSNVFQDNTETNSEVKKWISATPLDYIQRAFEDVKEAANGFKDTSESS